MSCPDWSRLVPSPDCRSDAAAERSWSEATEHLRHCRRCAAAAQERDPLLLFQRLPQLEVGERDILAMQQRVAGARRLLAASERPARAQRTRPGFLAAALVLALGLTWIASDLDREPPVEPPLVAAVAAVAADPEGLEEARRQVSKHLAMLPLVEGVARVSQQVQGPTADWVELSFESE